MACMVLVKSLEKVQFNIESFKIIKKILTLQKAILYNYHMKRRFPPIVGKY